MQEIQERPCGATGEAMGCFAKGARGFMTLRVAGRPEGAFCSRGRFAASPLHALFSVLCSLK